MMQDVIEAARQPFLDAATEIHGSLVYLDAGAAEVAQLTLGPAFLLGLGAANVCDLERCHPDDSLLPMLASGGEPLGSLAVFTTQLLPDAHQHLVHLLMVHPRVRRCTVFCSVSELAHAQLDAAVCSLGVEAYSEYATALRHDLAAARAGAGLPAPHEAALALSVRHLPLHAVAVDSQTFVLPAAGAVASRAIAGGRAAGYGGVDAPADHERDEAAVGISSGLSLLPHSLADLSRVLGARLDPFAIGPVSFAVARELAALPQAGARGGGGEAGGAEAGGGAGGPGAPGSIALVLVDRSLDLATPCMHAEHFLDALFAQLPRAELAAGAPLAGHQSAGQQHQLRARLRPADLRVDVPQLAPLAPLAPLTPPPTQPQQQRDQPEGESEQQQQQQAQPDAVPLCPAMGLGLFHPADRRWLGWLAQLWPKRGKDALLLLRRWLKEALRAEKLSPSTRIRLSANVSPAELQGLAQSLLVQPGSFLRHQPIVGLALAAAAALDAEGPGGATSSFAAVWDRLAGMERQLLLTLPQDSEGGGMLRPMLLEAIHGAGPGQGRLLLDHVVQLLAVVYSLSGDRLPPAPPLYSADEAQLRDALADALMAAAAAAAAAHGLQLQLECLPAVAQLLHEAAAAGRLGSDAEGVRAQLASQLHEVFQRLRWLAACRGKLRDVRRLMQMDADTGAASSVTPLLRQVLTKILLQADNRDLQQPENASLVAGLLHRGLGRLGLGGPARQRVSDYHAVLLFVVGGISPAEVREVRQELEDHKFGHKPLVLLGGTTLLSAADAARLLMS